MYLENIPKLSKIAIITARGGSKRIPRKNIKLFCGKPIIAYSIEAALKSKLFDEVMVSTDDQEIAEIAKIFGAKVPFYRSLVNSDDFSSTADVLNEVLNEYQKFGKNYDSFCCIYPTAPFLTDVILQKSFHEFKKNDYNSLMPVVQYTVPIQIALEINDQGLLKMLEPSNIKVRTQDMPNRYFDPGQFYWSKTVTFLKEKNIFSHKTGAYIISELQAQDIDNEQDWEIAELKYKLNNKYYGENN